MARSQPEPLTLRLDAGFVKIIFADRPAALDPVNVMHPFCEVPAESGRRIALRVAANRDFRLISGASSSRSRSAKVIRLPGPVVFGNQVLVWAPLKGVVTEGVLPPLAHPASAHAAAAAAAIGQNDFVIAVSPRLIEAEPCGNSMLRS